MKRANITAFARLVKYVKSWHRSCRVEGNRVRRVPSTEFHFTFLLLLRMLIVFVALGVYLAVEGGVAPAIQFMLAKRTPGGRR